MSEPKSRIMQFLRCESADYKNRWLHEMTKYHDYQIERSHDVIQWMFPTDLPSESRPDSPILTEVDIYQLQTDMRARLNIKRSLYRMTNFYEENDYWITQKNHNYKRLTRILRCLWIAGMKHDYVSLQKCLDEVFAKNIDTIGDEVFLYWKKANNLGYLMEKRDAVKRKQLPNDNREHTLEMFV